MKKSLFTLFSALLLATSAVSAFEVEKAPMTAQALAPASTGPARVATDNGYELRFCNEMYTWYCLTNSNNITYRCYLYITPELATALAGNELTSISFSCSVEDNRSGSIFVAEDIDGEPITSTDVTVVDSYSKGAPYYQTNDLEIPYEIKENTGFYFGFKVENCKNTASTIDYPVGIDGMSAGAFCGFVELIDSKGESLGSASMADIVDSNLFLAATTVGEKHSIDNLFNVNGVTIGNFTLPVLNTQANPQVLLSLTNFGSNALSEINYTTQVINGESLTNDLTIDIAPLETAVVPLDLPTLKAGRGEITVTINSINGVDQDRNYNAEYIGVNGEGYPRKFVVEEGTGTWCGWCPRGIVGFEYMEQTYPDTFIGIAIHGSDAMEVDSYSPILSYMPGFPGCIVNRDLIYIGDPSADKLEYMYDLWSTQIGAVNVDLKAEKQDDQLAVYVDATYAFSDGANEYLLAVVVLEKDIAGVQTNYYSGGQYGSCGGWEKYKSSQPWMYSHVARNIIDVYGIESQPMRPVSENGTWNLSVNVPLTNVADVNNTSLVALILDKTSGTILNAAEIHAEDYTTSGINAIECDNNAPVEYYNLQGMRMDSNNLPAGIYLKRQGTQVTKIAK